MEDMIGTKLIKTNMIHGVLQKCLMHYSMYKAIMPLDRVVIEWEKQTFWAMTANAHLQMAVILWCMVFGSKHNNPTHWEKIVIDQAGFFMRLNNSEVSKDEYTKYCRQMKCFRNKYISHTDEYSQPVPSFAIAQKAIYALNETMREIEPELKQLPSFSEWYPLYDEDNTGYIRSLL